MKHLKNLNEELDQKSSEDSVKIIQDLKSLPYREFMTKLVSLSGSQDFQDKVDKLSTSKSVFSDYGVIKNKSYKAEHLYPTQSQIGLKETLSWLSNQQSISEIILDKKADLFNNNRLLIANNKWIIDGHHRWAYVYMLNPKAEIPCININLPGNKPEEILKDIQISIAATYNDLYVKNVTIEKNISQIEDQDIFKYVSKMVPSDKLTILRETYAQTDLMKTILREFIVPESLYEARTIKQSDFIETDEKESEMPEDPKWGELETTDESNPEINNIMDTSRDWAGTLDPTGVVDVLNGIAYIYEGEPWLGILSILSALPLADIICKPLIAICKSVLLRKLMAKFAKFLKSFDARKAAEIWFDLEKHSPLFSQFLNFFVNNVQRVINLLEVIFRKISEKWLKFKVFYWLFKSKIIGFFQSLFNWRQKLKDYLNMTSTSDVIGILSSNVVKIKRAIVDKKIDKLNINFSIGPHPIQTALKAKQNPYSGDFKGVPKDLLNKLPNIVSGLKKIQIEPKKKKVEDFDNFKKKPTDQTDVNPEGLVEKPNIDAQKGETEIVNKNQNTNNKKTVSDSPKETDRKKQESKPKESKEKVLKLA